MKEENIIMFWKWDKVIYNDKYKNKTIFANNLAIISNKFPMWAELDKLMFFWCTFNIHTVDYKINYFHLKNCFFDELKFWEHSLITKSNKIDLALPEQNHFIDNIILELNTDNVENEKLNFNDLNTRLEKIKISFNRIWLNNLKILPWNFTNIYKISFIWTHNTEKSEVFIANMKINKLEIDYSFFEKWINFLDLEINELIISNSNLWKTTFNWVKINKLYLENATLNDCIFNWVEFWNDYRLENIEDEEWNIDYFKMKDNYRQLKFVMDKNWNLTEANKFFSREMDNYYLSLNWKENFSRKLLLSIQNLISFFWNDWIRVILWIFALVFITTTITFIYLDNIDYIKSFLFFLYPLYWLKKDFFEWFNSLMLFWFMSYKLIYWILLWHLAVALKRTTKR